MVDPLSSVLDGTDPLSLFVASADSALSTANTVTFKDHDVKLD